MRALTITSAGVAAFLLTPWGLDVQAEDRIKAAGQERSRSFIDGDVTTIWAGMTTEMRQVLGSVEALAAFRERLVAALGKEADIIKEETSRKGEADIYLRTSRWSGSKQSVQMQWVFDDKLAVSGFFVRQEPVAADSRFLNYVGKAKLRLPFDGAWDVYWGGRTIEQNYHAADGAQRFAVDLVARQDDASHAGEPDKPESYFCWNRPVLAPASGTVAAAVGDQPDQAIGQSDPKNPAGNHVVLEVAAGEYLFLAHLREGSVRPNVGDAVVAGQEIGRCGNSGNTSEPHLHMHLQTTPDLSSGEGLPMRFEEFWVDGRQTGPGELLKGQTVSATP